MGVIRPIVALRVINIETGEQEVVYALLDSGSDRDCVSERMARRLGLDLRATEVNLATADATTREMRLLGKVAFESIDGEYRAEVDDVLFETFPAAEDEIPPARRDLSEWPHLKDIEFINLPDGAKVEVILSVAHADLWL